MFNTMDDALNKEGLQILEALRTTAQLLDYEVEYYISGNTKIRKSGGLKIHLFSVEEAKLEVMLYDKNYQKFSTQLIDVQEEKHKVLKKLFEIL